MNKTLSNTIDTYLSSGHSGEAYSIEDEISIIDNPSFDILPNHPYRSPFAVAIYCKSGSGRGRINAKTYIIEAGGLFIVLPDQITEMVDVSADFSATYVIMSNRFTESLSIGNTFDLRNIVIERPYSTLEQRSRCALEDYLSMCRNIIPIKQNPHRLEILRLLTQAFFLGLGYFLHEQYIDDVGGSRQTDITSEFVRLVEANYREHRNLSFYADTMGLTSKYLSTVVKTTSGSSAVEWIERYVVLDAKTQLSSTDRTVKQIAYDLNFPSQSFFGKYFARVVGVSPATYRNKERV